MNVWFEKQKHHRFNPGIRNRLKKIRLMKRVYIRYSYRGLFEFSINFFILYTFFIKKQLILFILVNRIHKSVNSSIESQHQKLYPLMMSRITYNLLWHLTHYRFNLTIIMINNKRFNFLSRRWQHWNPNRVVAYIDEMLSVQNPRGFAFSYQWILHK